jgi:hypothetical protein
MLDDPGDIDRNGIPDAIQRDPVVAPGEPRPFSMYETDGLPGIDTPVDATPVDATPAPIPEAPIAPTPPDADADEAAMLRYQQEMQNYQRLMEIYSSVVQQIHDTQKSIISNIRA